MTKETLYTQTHQPSEIYISDTGYICIVQELGDDKESVAFAIEQIPGLVERLNAAYTHAKRQLAEGQFAEPAPDLSQVIDEIVE